MASMRRPETRESRQAPDVVVLNPLRPTRRPDWMGKVYFLCKTCNGSGERKRPEPEPAPKLTSEGQAKKAGPSIKQRIDGTRNDCPACEGKGVVLR